MRRKGFFPLLRSGYFQAFRHLIANALDAMPAGGRLSIRVRSARDWGGADEDGVTVTVADTGTGIQQPLSKHLFEPFFSTRGKLKAGLGLWATQETVHNHKGRITFRSRTGAIHHGTVFRLFLPFSGVLAPNDSQSKQP